MAVRRKDTGPRRQIRVKCVGEAYPELTGKMVTLKELSTISGLDWQLVYDRWRRRGKPGLIDDSLVSAKGELYPKPFHLLPDDTWHTGREMSGMFGVPESSLNARKRERGKTEYTQLELNNWAKMAEDAARINRSKRRPVAYRSPLNIETIDYQPGPLERALLAL